MSKHKSKKKKNTKLILQGVVRLVKKDDELFLPVPSKLLKSLNINPLSQLYWTAVDGVLQLTTDSPVMVIPVLDRPEERFEAQRV